MKLNDFFDKSSTPKTPNKIITVVNEIRENELKGQVSELENEIKRLQVVEVERDSFNQRMQAAEIQLNETIEINEQLSYEKVLLEEEIKSKDGLKVVNQDLTNDLRDVRGQLGIQGSVLEQAQKNNLELNTTVKDLTTNLEALQKDDAALKVALEESYQNSAANKHSIQEFIKQFKDIEEKFNLTQVKYKEMVKRNSDLSKHLEYWERVANTLQDEKDHLEESRTMLKNIAFTMEEENQEHKGIAKVKQVELKKLKDTVKTMTTNIDSLIEENKYLAGLSAALKEELARPKYMSMSQIERSEGFKMPMGGSRTHFLGQGKPTLLKFKNGGSKNDN